MAKSFDPLTFLMDTPEPTPPRVHIFTRSQVVAPDREAWVRLRYVTSHTDGDIPLTTSAVHEGIWRADGRLDLNEAGLNYELRWSPPLLPRGSYDLVGPLPEGWRLWVDEPPAHLVAFAARRGIEITLT